MTWAPGLPQLIVDRLMDRNSGWIDRPGCTTFNLYRPPVVKLGDPSAAGPWVAHVKLLYPNDAEHIINYLSHRVQFPGDKINHGLLLGGAPGIGKDTLLEPVKYAVGPWNFQEITPPHLTQQFNGFVKSVILRINEARDLGEGNRWDFYERSKLYLAAPPDFIRCNDKLIQEHPVMNVCAVIFTTNYKDGLYIPADDRRHYVAWSEKEMPPDFTTDYWNELWGFCEERWLWPRRCSTGHA